MKTETKLTGFFKADLSDKVKIPKRGTSASSYGKEEQKHQNILNELDGLFANSKPYQAHANEDQNFSLPRPTVNHSDINDLIMDEPNIS